MARRCDDSTWVPPHQGYISPKRERGNPEGEFDSNRLGNLHLGSTLASLSQKHDKPQENGHFAKTGEGADLTPMGKRTNLQEGSTLAQHCGHFASLTNPGHLIPAIPSNTRLQMAPSCDLKLFH